MHRWQLILLFAGVLLGARCCTAAAKKLHDDHDDHDHEEGVDCPITADSFAFTYMNIVKEMAIVDPQDGEECAVPDEGDNQMVVGDDFEDYEVCKTLFYFSQRLVLDLNATEECCLLNISSCHHNSSDTPSRTVDKAKAFGYGTAMVVVLSLLSLLGILILPFLRRNTALGRYYQHFNLFMIALGASALFSDAVLHLLPQAFGLHHHHDDDDDDGDHSHSHGSGVSGLLLVWRTCAVVGGVYFFYITEHILHWLTGGQHHSHGNHQAHGIEGQGSVRSDDPTQLLIKDKTLTDSKVPHSSPQAKGSTHGGGAVCGLKPLAILIICGDAIHNFTDGIALGASISESLALGISTALAIIFHEIPHELGNFAILLATGMKWQYVLLVSFFSSCTAFVGFYIGAGVGILSEEANVWLLAIAAGTFLYVALVDLLPLIMSTEVKGCTGLLLTNIGFFISFNILLVIAIFEDNLDQLFSSQI